MTANRFSSRFTWLRRRYCAIAPPPIKTGMRNRLIRNALVLTAALYSRRATMSILCMTILLRLRPRNAYEDIVQRRPCDLEVEHLSALDQRRQGALRVRRGGQSQLLILPKIGDRLHTGQLIESRRIDPE